MKLYASAFSAIVILVLAILFGVRLGLYDTVPYLDKVFHLLGGATLAAFALSWFEKDLDRIPRGIAILFAVGIATIIGIFWEVGEASSGTLAKDVFPLFYKYFHGGGLWDTLGDLVVDVVGALALATAWLRNHGQN